MSKYQTFYRYFFIFQPRYFQRQSDSEFILFYVYLFFKVTTARNDLEIFNFNNQSNGIMEQSTLLNVLPICDMQLHTQEKCKGFAKKGALKKHSNQ